MSEQLEFPFMKSVEQLQFDYLMQEIERLKKLLADRSCCCSGCTKHNLVLEEKASNGEFSE